MVCTLALCLSAAQMHFAILSYTYGAQYDEGFTFSAIIYQESSYCQNKVNGWSRGCGGLKRKTARLFDPEVTRQQLTDDNARNLHDSLLYLLECKRRTDSWRRMVFAYHMGIPMALKASKAQIDSNQYVLAIIYKIHELQSITIDTE